MRMNRFLVGAATVAVIGFGSQAFAAPIVATNVRPAAGVTSAELNTGSVPPYGSNGLQSILDGIYGCTGCVNAFTDQSTAAMWGLPGIAGTVTAPILTFESGAYASSVAFGIWSGSDTTAITSYEIFTGAASTGELATVSWKVGDPNTVYITGGAGTSTACKLGCAGVSRYAFGFYITSPDGGTDGRHWSADSINDGGVAQMLAYLGPAGRWTLAWEDLNRVTGADDNFYDLVISTESLVAIPEPGSMLLLGSGLLGLASAARRRMRKNAAK